MSESKTAPKKPARSAPTSSKADAGFSAEERAAMKARAQELKAQARADNDRAEGEKAVLAAIAAMQEPDRGMATRLHAIVTASAPGLSPKTFYGMPAYARDGKVVCFFQSGLKFKTRYCTFGFQDAANLDDGTLWPVSFALTELTAAAEARIAAMVKKAAG